MEREVGKFSWIVVLLFFIGCSSEMEKSSYDYADLISTFDFETADQEWVGGISDFPLDYIGSEDFIINNKQSLQSDVYNGDGISVSAENPEGDIFYFFKREITGFKKNTTYKLDFDFLAFSKVENEIQESEDLFMKVGAVNYEPVLDTIRTENEEEYTTLNVDKGESNAGSGSDLINIGSIKEYTSKDPVVISGNTFDIPMQVTSDSNGTIWLVIGVDSGIKSTLTFSLAAITVYYTEILG